MNSGPSQNINIWNKIDGKKQYLYEDSKDSLHRKNVFKCTCYTIDHGKLLTLLQLRGLQLRGMVGPMGHLAILKVFLSQAEWGQYRVSEGWGCCWTLDGRSWTVILCPEHHWCLFRTPTAAAVLGNANRETEESKLDQELKTRGGKWHSSAGCGGLCSCQKEEGAAEKME